MPDEPVDPYLNTACSEPLLSAQEEVALAGSIRAARDARTELAAVRDPAERARLQVVVRRGARARERMIRANLRLVVSMARRYGGTGVPLLDVVQDGTIGLMQAVDRFDPAYGTKFSTYAVLWVRQAINRGLADAVRTVRLPVTVLQRLNSLHGRRGELYASTGRAPSTAELADACGFTERQVRDLDALTVEPVPLQDGPYGSLDTGDRHAPPCDEVVDRRVARQRLRDALGELDPFEARVLRLRYGFGEEPLGATEVARRLGVTRDRIRHVEQRALAALALAPGVAELAPWSTEDPEPPDAPRSRAGRGAARPALTVTS